MYALNNRGDDALLAGELDDWGGHCGRADDYHYHIAPTHLQTVVGKKVPIAYALDGFTKEVILCRHRVRGNYWLDWNRPGITSCIILNSWYLLLPTLDSHHHLVCWDSIAFY